MLEVQNLTKQFGNVLAVNDISFKVEKGEVFGLLGTNGAGKTTTMKILSCLLNPTSGTALVDGLEVTQNQLEVKKRIGYLPEMPNLFEKLTGREFMSMLGTLRGLDPELLEKRVAEYIRILEFGDFLDLEIGTYSKGMRQRVAFASSVLHEPPILILDEPTSGLDSESEAYIQKALARLHGEKTIVVIAHRLATVIQADQLLVVDQGRVVERGTHSELVAHDGPYHKLFETQLLA